MPKSNIHPNFMKPFAAVGSMVAAVAMVSACAGGVSSSGPIEDSGSGFEYGASQEEVNEAVADLEPMVLNFQHISGSPDVPTAQPALDFKEEVESRSNGNITVDITWNMAIAGMDEVVAALSDGRVDLSFFSTGYYPQQFPEVDGLGLALSSVEYSPLVGEMVAYAVGSELGWTDEVIERYEGEGLVPLVPLTAAGAYSLSCGSEMSSADDIVGKQVRAGAAAQGDAISRLDGVPTSISYAEVYEAMQRGTVDCDLSAMSTKELSGVYDVAPHLAYTTTANFPRFPSSYMAGSKFQDMPLAYQQIIADSSAFLFSGDLQSYMNSNVKHINDLNSVDGTITEFDEESQDRLAEVVESLQSEAIEAGTLDEATMDQIAELEETWKEKVLELGYEDGGDMGSVGDWIDESADLSDYAWKVHEESGALNYRPGSDD